MTLIERSVTFANGAKDLDALKKSANLVTAVGTRAQMFETALANLRLAAGQFALLQEHGVTVDTDRSSVDGFVHHLGVLRAATLADPSVLTEDAPKTLTPLRAFSAALSEACATAWGRYVDGKLPRVGADLLPVLAQVPALKARVEGFRALQTAALSKADSLPTGAADFAALDQAASACHAAWEALDADSIPFGVTRFLRSATSRAGADIDSLTEEVSTWLKAHNLAASFTIRAR
ncbi:MAG: hypothetical protein WA840_03655 [Caulobacteraceae bacterium]